MESLAERYERTDGADQGAGSFANSVRRWVDKQLEDIERQLDGGVESQPETPDDWFTAVVYIDRFSGRGLNYFKPHLASLEHELYSKGWSVVLFEPEARGWVVNLWALRKPLFVFPDDGEPFPARLGHGADADLAARQIAAEGTWRYVPGGTREFIPANRIKRIQHGVGSAPGGE